MEINGALTYITEAFQLETYIGKMSELEEHGRNFTTDKMAKYFEEHPKIPMMREYSSDLLLIEELIRPGRVCKAVRVLCKLWKS